MILDLKRITKRFLFTFTGHRHFDLSQARRKDQTTKVSPFIFSSHPQPLVGGVDTDITVVKPKFRIKDIQFSWNMLKFTKYGRKSSTGSFTVNSLSDSISKARVSSNEATATVSADATDSSIRLSHYRSYSRKDGGDVVGLPIPMKGPEFHNAGGGRIIRTEKSHFNYYNPSHKPLSSSSDSKEVIRSFHSPPKTTTEVHLRISKITPEELRKMDSEIIRPGQHQQESKSLGKSVSFTGSKLDLFKLKKRRSLKNASTASVSLRNIPDNNNDKVRVPVFEDGYFPRVQPLSKIFAKKRSQ